MITLSPKQMYQKDKETIQDFGIPSRVLMENAGKGCADEVKKNYPNSTNFCILCGVGNNGGDGFVIARWLYSYGKNVKIIFIGNEAKMSKETSANYELCQKLSLDIYHFTVLDQFTKSVITTTEVLIDTIFGIGFQGQLREPIHSFIRFCNEQTCTRIAIDIASGLNAETGLTNFAFQAHETFAIAAKKTGHLLGNGKHYSGKITVIPIGIPNFILHKDAFKLNLEETLSFPPRSNASHKTSYGKLGIIAGSKGMGGAAIMASFGALRAGAGLVTLIYPDDIHNEISPRCLEVMQKPFCYETKINDIEQAIQSMDALLIGPGLGTEKHASEIVEYLLKNWKKTLIIDADGLHILSQNIGLMRFLTEKTILTPHVGEFSRLIQKSSLDLQSDIFTQVNLFCTQFPCTLVLKSATTIIRKKDEIWFNTTGNNGLSTGGSGDILAGLILGFIGQGSSSIMASKLATFYLGKTAETVSLKRKTASILPRDIIENLFVKD